MHACAIWLYFVWYFVQYQIGLSGTGMSSLVSGVNSMWYFFKGFVQWQLVWMCKTLQVQLMVGWLVLAVVSSNSTGDHVFCGLKDCYPRFSLKLWIKTHKRLKRMLILITWYRTCAKFHWKHLSQSAANKWQGWNLLKQNLKLWNCFYKCATLEVDLFNRSNLLKAWFGQGDW